MAKREQFKSGCGGYLVVALIAAGAVYSIAEKRLPSTSTATPIVVPALREPVSVAPKSVAGPQPEPSPHAPKLRPLHHYGGVERSTYYYAAAVSEEDRSKGRTAPNMVGFWYLGRDRLQNFANDTGGVTSNCARPRAVIHYADGTTLEV